MSTPNFFHLQPRKPWTCLLAAMLVMVLPPALAAGPGSPDSLRALAGAEALFLPDTAAPAATDPLVQLGGQLFFSRSLSGNRDVACASCHHPLLGGGDSLSLPVGEAATEPNLLGPGRRHSQEKSKDPRADGLPNVPRNSPTVFNSGLFTQALFMDGRVVQVADGIVTPDSGFGATDPDAGSTLLTAQTRFPVTSAEEMRGFSFHPDASGREVRAALVQRLRTAPHRLGRQAGWRQAFARVFGLDEPLITFARVNQALAAWQESQQFMASPWQQFLAGDNRALTAAQQRGALLFHLPPEQGGAGCVRCHSGPLFSDERYHNLAVPQFGRGKGRQGSDLGRERVTRQPADSHAFRTPTLTNVSVTGPWGHTGAFADLASIIRHHLDPGASLANFDFSLAGLPQFAGSREPPWPQTTTNTAAALARMPTPAPASTTAAAHAAAPTGADDVADLVAFLGALTDPCVTSPACLQAWLPDPDRDPDGWQLRPRFQIQIPPLAVGPKGQLPDDFAQLTVAGPGLGYGADLLADPPANAFAASLSGADSVDAAAPDAQTDQPSRGPAQLTSGFQFLDVTSSQGPAFSHQLPLLSNPRLVVANQQLYMAGGAAAGDLDGDGDPDLYLTSGGGGGTAQLFRNDQGHFVPWPTPTVEIGGHLSGPGMADLDGDGDLDLVVGGVREVQQLADGLFNVAAESWLPAQLHVFRNDQPGFVDITADTGLTAKRNVFGSSFADVDLDGDLDLFLTHWDLNSSGEDVHLWLNTGGNHFIPGDQQAGLAGLFSPRDFTFTALFTDLNNNGWPDLLLASDFLTSRVLANQGNGQFQDVTDARAITDQNGMGAAVGDFDGDLDMDWFVTSIYDNTGSKPVFGTWGITGNRYYRNNNGVLEDATSSAGVRDGNWGWAACSGDLDLDGDLDLLQLTGYGDAQSPAFQAQTARFKQQPARLFLNDGDAYFREAAALAGIADTGQGRALLCFDSDGDGDLDVLIGNSNGPARLYRNMLREQGNPATSHWLQVHLHSPCGNTLAVGGRVELQAESAEGKQQVWVREIRSGSGYVSHEPARAHFGLGAAAYNLKLRIRWPVPGGPWSEHQLAAADARVDIQLPAALAAQCRAITASSGN